MKANELMIGDWVKHAVTNEVLQVSEFTLNEDLECQRYYVNGILVENVESIPLTTEILEKNGFERTNDYHFFDGDEYYDMELRELSDSIWFVEYTDLEFSMPSQRMIVCNVHELQHALRLCGIEKEIQL